MGRKIYKVFILGDKQLTKMYSSSFRKKEMDVSTFDGYQDSFAEDYRFFEESDVAIIVLPNTSISNLNKAKASNKEGIIFVEKNDVEYLIEEVEKLAMANQNM